MANLLQKLTDRFACDLAIDMGSTNTVIFRKGRGIVVNEPSLVAFQRCSPGSPCSVRTGAGAKKLLVLPRDEVTIVKPVQFGAIADFAAAKEMLTSYFQRIKGPWSPRPVRVIANVPARATAQEKKVIRKLIHAAGASEVYLMEEPRALALGAGLDISSDRSNLIVDIGGSITEMAVIAQGRVVKASAIRTGGDNMDQAIAAHIRKHHRLHIHAQTAEDVKILIGNAYPARKDKSVTVIGRHLASDSTGSVQVTAQEVRDALSGTLSMIVSAIKSFLRSLSPQQSVDILDRGIALAGGSALLGNIELLLERELVYPFLKVSDPLTCPILGSGDALDCLDQFVAARQ